MRRPSLLLPLLTGLALQAGCGGGGGGGGTGGTGGGSTTQAVAIGIAPGSVDVPAGTSFQFVAGLAGTTNAAVTWAVVETGGGTISTHGLYTAPAKAGQYHVTVTSQADPAKSARATVNVTPAPPGGGTSAPTVAVGIAPGSVDVPAGTALQFVAGVMGTSNAAVSWAVLEAGGGTISGTGLYRAPATQGVYHISVTSQADPSKSARATVNVTPAPPGGGTTPTPQPTIMVGISPGSADVPVGTTLQFAAAVAGTSNVGVSWAVSEAGGGAISTTGLYTAPAKIGLYHVTVTSKADPTKKATATVNITPGGGTPAQTVMVGISPGSVDVPAGTSLQFTAAVGGTNNAGVIWAVVEAGGGSVSSTGLYRAPATQGVYHVSVTSQADLTKSARATVNITPAPSGGGGTGDGTTPTVQIGISPGTASVSAGTTLQFTVALLGTSDAGVNWSVVEAGGGTVSSSGLYQAPNTSGQYHVVVRSRADPTKSATATVNVAVAIAVSIEPVAATVSVGESAPFAATVTGTTFKVATWRVQEVGGGTITQAGVYTAPATTGTYHVIAASQEDPSKTATAIVTVVAGNVDVSVE